MDQVQEFMAVFRSLKKQEAISGGEHSAGQERSLPETIEFLRREAVVARQQLKEARYLVWYNQKNVYAWHRSLVQRLESGELEKDLQTKEFAYGHSTSLPKPISRHEAILFCTSCDGMDRAQMLLR